MAQNFNLRYTLVDGQGNFGSVDGDPPAAMRYTEARLTRSAVELMADLEKDTVEYVPNYDETKEEPTVFPGKFPNLLVNGSSGIAVGMATNIPPHNVREICAAITALIENPELPDEDLLEDRHGPGLPDRRHHLRPQRHPERLPDRPRPHRHCGRAPPSRRTRTIARPSSSRRSRTR